MDALVQRLVADPHDEEALAYAHRAGTHDPRAYAMVLEKVGNDTQDPAYASHWLSEAANVWATTLGDAHRAARVLMLAIDRDPTQRTAAERLAQLYRDKGDARALAALLDRRVKVLTPLAATDMALRGELGVMHEELGRLWSDQPLAQPRKAVDHFRRAAELDPENAFALYSARELLKSLGQYEEALPLYEAELALERDPTRLLALLRDEAGTRRSAGDLVGATRALLRARPMAEQDVELQHELAELILERARSGQPIPPSERTLAVELLVGMAEIYDGDHGFAYASGALELEAGHDRAFQLLVYYGRALQRDGELATRSLAYVQASPEGAMAAEARRLLSTSFEAEGKVADAIQILEPLAALGDDGAAARIRDLQSRSPLAGGGGPVGAGLRSGAASADKVQGVLDAATMLAGKGKKPEAFAKYKEVLDAEPAHTEALAWVEDYLRTRRDYVTLRDILLAAVRGTPSSPETLEGRKERLREIAGLCEGNLRDTDGAVSAWKQLLVLDRSDESARQALSRILDKSQRWDELANLLEQEAATEQDVEKKVGLEKRLATLHEQKRRDFGGAAEAWARIARLSPEDDRAVVTASRFFEKAGRLEQAAQMLQELGSAVADPVAKGGLFERLGDLREQLADPAGAGAAYAEAADAMKSAKLWDAAERCFVTAEDWTPAANAAAQRALLSSDTKVQAQHHARAADHLTKAGDLEGARLRLEQATDLDPTSDEYASQLVDRYSSTEAWPSLVRFFARRGDRLADRAKRVALRREAAYLYATRLSDKDAAREQWLKVLEDGDDREALEKLIDAAVERDDHTEATTLLRRLGNIAVDKADKARVALREAELLAEGVGDVDTAIARYEAILTDLDPTSRPALQAIADLQEARDNQGAAADALERELKLVGDVTERGQIAGRLARLYDTLDNPHAAIRALDIVRKADLDDFDALARLCELCERVEQWDRVAELLAQRIEVEADEQEAATMTKRLSDILADRLDRGDEALAALTELADQGDAMLRQAYVDLGDRLNWKGIVAQKLVEWWFEARHSPERTANLRGAFDRFAEVGRDQDAVRVAMEIVRAKGADRQLAERLEALAVKTSDQDALETAHELLLRELSGAPRAVELVRQAEVRVKAGTPRQEALQHGEGGLAGLPLAEADKLLDRLGALAEKPADVVDLFERQVGRCKAPADRVRALAKAAQVAAQRGQLARAGTFLELALSGTPSDETLALLERSARDGDDHTGGERLRRALCAAMAAGGQGARDGGRTRGSLLRRAASMAHRDLGDVEQAFAWLGDALVAHVDSLTLDSLEGLGVEIGDVARAEMTLTRALAEVFDGPLVRQLLSRRAKIRREHLLDRSGAAGDLKKLHDLSPGDQAVLVELSSLLAELGDFRSLVQLYEDQILRGKDMNTRAELARKVARMWEERLNDAREAADAWRRVLRMRPGDAEATAGLERAKGNMLKKPDAPAEDAYAPPITGAVPAVTGAVATVTGSYATAPVSLQTAVGDSATRLEAAPPTLPHSMTELAASSLASTPSRRIDEPTAENPLPAATLGIAGVDGNLDGALDVDVQSLEDEEAPATTDGSVPSGLAPSPSGVDFLNDLFPSQANPTGAAAAPASETGPITSALTPPTGAPVFDQSASWRMAFDQAPPNPDPPEEVTKSAGSELERLASTMTDAPPVDEGALAEDALDGAPADPGAELTDLLEDEEILTTGDLDFDNLEITAARPKSDEELRGTEEEVDLEGDLSEMIDMEAMDDGVPEPPPPRRSSMPPPIPRR